MAVVGIAFFVCVLVIFLSDNPEKAKWATTLLTTIVAGGVGYMTGKGSRS